MVVAVFGLQLEHSALCRMRHTLLLDFQCTNSVASGVAKGVARQWKAALSWPSSTAEAVATVEPLANHPCVLVGQLSVVWLSKTDCMPGHSATDFSPEPAQG